MSFRTTPRFTQGTETQDGEAAAAGYATNTVTAKVTLVKPMQDDTDMSEAQKIPAMSAARPKVGRAPSTERLPLVNNDAVYGIAEEYTDPDHYDVAHGYAGKEGTHLWDSRFAVLLVMLLVLVNAGLAALLQHSHKNAPEISATRQEKIGGDSLLVHEKLMPAQEKKLPNPPIHAPAAPVQTAQPASSGALLDLPGNKTASTIARPARAQGNAQDLLTIINKE